MSVNLKDVNPKVVVFAGAGASVGLGMPTTPQFVQKLKENGWANVDKCVDIYRRYCKDTDSFLSQNIDIEELRDWLLSLKTMSRYTDELLKNPPNAKILPRTVDTSSSLNLILKELDSLIRKTYGKTILPGTVQGHYRPLFDNITKYNIPFLPFFTTNYDMALEALSEAPNEKYEIEYGAKITGARTILDINRFKKVSLSNSKTTIHLLKIHGSINWWKDKKTGEIKIVEPEYATPSEYEDLIIYPTRGKILQVKEEPFSFFYNKLSDYLGTAKICIVIGYSFRDKPINDLFENPLRNSLRLLVLNC